MRNGRGGACHIRTFAGPAQGPPSTAGAGDAAGAIVPHSPAPRQYTRPAQAGRRGPPPRSHPPPPPPPKTPPPAESKRGGEPPPPPAPEPARPDTQPQKA